METQQQNTTIPEENWLVTEEQNIDQCAKYEQLPALKLEENKIVEIEIDFSKPFDVYIAENNGKKVNKAIIPVTHEAVKKTFWLNKSNPIYKEIIKLGRTGQKKFRIMQTGTKQNTKYIIVK